MDTPTSEWKEFLKGLKFSEENPKDRVTIDILVDKKTSPRGLIAAKPKSEWDSWLISVQITDADHRSAIVAGLMRLQAPLRYKEPQHPMQSATGHNWTYQPPPADVEELMREHLELHYDTWKKGNVDKLLHVLFLALWGPGRGKSRLLDEFLELCRKLSAKNPELKARFNNPYVFKLTFENGTSVIEHSKIEQLSGRMLHQLTATQGQGLQISDDTPPPSTVIMSMLEAEGAEPRDATILLLVDSVQKLHMVDPELLRMAILQLSDLVNTSTPFVVACATSTFYEPISKILHSSNQRRCLIPSYMLDGHKIITQEDPVVHALVEDMGGHGRALGALQDSLAKVDDLENFDVDRLLLDVVSKVAIAYPDVLERAHELVPAILHVFMRKPISRTEQLGQGDLTAEYAVQMGLFEYDIESSTLNCPFVLLCLLSQWSNDRTLAHLDLPAYNRLKKNSTEIQHAGQFWQDWEEFLAQYRELKSKLYRSKVGVKFCDLHAGALLGKDADVLVREKCATGLLRSPHIIYNNEAREYCRTNPTKVVINAATAPASDLFYGIKVQTKAGWEGVVEHTQAKHTQVTTTIKKWKEESAKAVQGGDFFMLFTTEKASISSEELPPRGGLVSKENFLNYFGPYAARAFRAVEIDNKRHINKCTFAQLCEAKLIGPSKAKRILDARDNGGDFKDREDFKKRTRLPRTYSDFFLYDSPATSAVATETDTKATSSK